MTGVLVLVLGAAIAAAAIVAVAFIVRQTMRGPGLTLFAAKAPHRNLLKVRVRVSYQADPEHAMKVLQQVAEQNTSILRHPPPAVVLDNLGDQALEFSVRVYLADINRSLQAQTELRTAILKALRAEGIDVPYASALAGHAHGPAPTARQASITIGVPHDCDPEAVQAALKEAARQGGFAADGDGKGPQVAFDDIGENALNFSVTVPLVDGISAEDAETALRTQAVKALRARGIALASPQRQVRLRDLEGLRTFVMKLAEQRARSAQARNDDDAPMPPRKPDND